MEARIDRLDRAVERVDADLTAIKVSVGRIEERLKHTATKEQVESVRSDLIKWFVGTALVLAGLVFTAAKLIH